MWRDGPAFDWCRWLTSLGYIPTICMRFSPYALTGALWSPKGFNENPLLGLTFLLIGSGIQSKWESRDIRGGGYRFTYICTGCTCLCMQVCWPEEDLLYNFPWDGVALWTWSQMGSHKVQGFSYHLPPPVPYTSITDVWTAMSVHVFALLWPCEGAGYPNSCPHICTARTSTHWTIFQPKSHTLDLTSQPQW